VTVPQLWEGRVRSGVDVVGPLVDPGLVEVVHPGGGVGLELGPPAATAEASCRVSVAARSTSALAWSMRWRSWSRGSDTAAWGGLLGLGGTVLELVELAGEVYGSSLCGD
jgi:hypothetical protein